MIPTVDDAKARAEVVLPDGRHAWLHSIPGSKRQGKRARVVLESGKYLSVAPEELRLA